MKSKLTITYGVNLSKPTKKTVNTSRMNEVLVNNPVSTPTIDKTGLRKVKTTRKAIARKALIDQQKQDRAMERSKLRDEKLTTKKLEYQATKARRKAHREFIQQYTNKVTQPITKQAYVIVAPNDYYYCNRRTNDGHITYYSKEDITERGVRKFSTKFEAQLQLLDLPEGYIIKHVTYTINR